MDAGRKLRLSVPMSRGFGWVQQAVLAYLYEYRFGSTRDIARAVFVRGALDPVPCGMGTSLRPWAWPEDPRVKDFSASDIRSLRRALRRLRGQGLVASCGKTELLWMMPRGVPARMGWKPRGPGIDIRIDFDPKEQRRRKVD
jgi:hypothetical protein